ncbi:hypothetical protein [Brevundimonas sp. UBA7664]|uniref:hypothetical protein n=1 Tax=Brevundimonas sp. UBA7664 TaxID=1946141 RepID=UPI0025BCF226|nr:hypothetical protein [Brevundimonas sp. UBA7664]
MKVTQAQFFGFLKALPLVRFALMLGGGLVATIGVAHVQLWLLGHRGFPNLESVWLARVQGAVALGLAATAIIAIVMVTLAFGKAGRVGFKGAGFEVDVDFDEPDSPPPSGDPS